MPAPKARSRRPSNSGAPAAVPLSVKIVRCVLLLVIVLIGYVSVVRTLGYMLRGRAIETAHALAPNDARITARLAQTLSLAGATDADRTRADTLARQALRHDPTAVAAVSALGLNAQARGDTTAARRLFAYAAALSRRDLVTQLWAIEDAVAREDVAGALAHYDIALRTSPEATAVLFPVLATAITDPAIRAALIRTLAARPSWSGDFIAYAAGKGPDARATAALFVALNRVRLPVAEEAAAILTNNLVSQGFPDDAWAWYARRHPGADRRMSRDPRFTANPTPPSLFDWMPINDAGTVTSIQRGDEGGIFDFASLAGVAGPLLQQMQLLPPGAYRLDGHSIGMDEQESSGPYWLLRCRDGRELGRVAIPHSAQAGGAFAGRFDVPPDCPVQMLVLIARPTAAASRLAGQLDQVRLVPAP